jgi:hypothetical protein
MSWCGFHSAVRLAAKDIAPSSMHKDLGHTWVEVNVGRMQKTGTYIRLPRRHHDLAQRKFCEVTRLRPTTSVNAAIMIRCGTWSNRVSRCEVGSINACPKSTVQSTNKVPLDGDSWFLSRFED